MDEFKITSKKDVLFDKIKQIVTKLPLQQRHRSIITDIIMSVTKATKLYKMERYELVSVVRVVQELLGAFGMFSMFKHIPKVTIFGSARIKPDNPEYQLTRHFATLMQQEGYYIITGGGPGIMQAGNEGAGIEHSFGLNIMLPFEQTSNPYIHGDIKDYTFRYFFTRKLMFIKESSAIVVCPGGYGTMDELYEALTLIQNGKSSIIPIVLLNTPESDFWPVWDDFAVQQYQDKDLIAPHDKSLYKILTSAEDARNEILTFYKNFHSYRYWTEKILIIRVKKKLTSDQIDLLTKNYKDICMDGRVHDIKDQPFFDKNDPDMKDMFYLALHFNQRDFGALRRLIDTINQF